MFEEVAAVVDELKTHIEGVKRISISGGNYFIGLALAVAYNHLIELVDTRTQEHVEVRRAPELRTILIDHLILNADKHINVQTGTIFNDSLLGTPRSLRDWQEAGYHARRSTSNYEKRLNYWKALYDNAPVAFQQRVDTPGKLFDTQRTYQSSFISPKGKIVGRAHKKSGEIVTYEDVILARNTRYGETVQIVPWWAVLNYGTGGKGYPISPGLHFIEDAERHVPALIHEYEQHFEQFINDVFDRDTITTDDILTVEQWAYANIKIGTQYISAFDLARILSFGVPF